MRSLPLLHGQKWFLEQVAPTLLNPADWCVSTAYSIAGGIDEDRVVDAIHQLWQASDGLRLIFRYGGGAWEQVLRPPGTPAPLRVVETSPHSGRPAADLLPALVRSAAGRLRLDEELANFLVVTDRGVATHMVMTVHHAVADAQSIMCMERALAAAIAGAALPRVADYADCVARIQGLGASAEAQDELDRWTQLHGKPGHGGLRRPVTGAPQPGLVPLVLPEGTATRLGAATRAGAGAMTGALIACLAWAVRDRYPARAALLFNVLHSGRSLTREEAGGDRRFVLPPAAANTVGLLVTTGVIPVPVPAGDADVHACRDGADRALTSWSNSGVTVKLAADHRDPAARAAQRADFMVNYQGELLGELPVGPLSPVLRTGLSDPLWARPRIELNAAVNRGRFEAFLEFDTRAFGTDDLAAVAAGAGTALAELLRQPLLTR